MGFQDSAKCVVRDSVIENNWIHDNLSGTTQGDGIEIKVGSHSNLVKDNVIYIEAHPFLDEDTEKYENNLTSVVALIINISNDKHYELDWSAAYDAINKPTGLPIAIGRYLSEVMQAKVDEISTKALSQAEQRNLQLQLDSHLSN